MRTFATLFFFFFAGVDVLAGVICILIAIISRGYFLDALWPGLIFLGSGMFAMMLIDSMNSIAATRDTVAELLEITKEEYAACQRARLRREAEKEETAEQQLRRIQNPGPISAAPPMGPGAPRAGDRPAARPPRPGVPGAPPARSIVKPVVPAKDAFDAVINDELR